MSEDKYIKKNNVQNNSKALPANELENTLDNAGVELLPPYIYCSFLMAALVLEGFYGANLFSWGMQLSIGLLLICLAAGLMTWCILRFTNAGTNLAPNEPTTAIVTDGPFSVSRNPIYIALTSLYLGLVILLDIIWGFPLLIPLIYVVQTYVIAHEEAYLTRKFGTEYTEYKKKVRRWL